MSLFAPRRILCAVDLSPATPAVIRWAGLFAETYGAKLEILHADWQEWPPYFTAAQIQTLVAENQEHLAALRDELGRIAREALGVKASYATTVVEDYPVAAILDHASAHAPQLIVMGSHGRSGMARLRLGSVAENVVRETAIPTLVVKAGANQQTPKISSVLCPVSFTKLASRGLELSASVASAFKAKLLLMHAVEQETDDLQRTHERLCQWVPEEMRAHCDLVEVVRRGNAAEQVVLLARERGVDLIVLGAEHRPFFEFTTLGTTTERVVRYADSNVLVLPWKAS